MNNVSKILILLFFIGCGGSGGSSLPSEKDVFDKEQKDFLYNLFQTEYLWHDEINTNQDYKIYQTPKEMIDGFKYTTRDKWSYSQTNQEYEDNANQIAQGFGCYYDNTTIKRIDIGSPCEKSGLLRGDTVLKVNHKDGTKQVYDEAQNNIGVKSTFTILRNMQGNPQEVDVDITPSKYTYKSTKTQIITRANGTKIGHMIFDRFTSTSADEIDEAFNKFKNQNIDELIVDLRYNRGGSLTTASVLMDKIAGHNNIDKIQMHLKWNDNNSDKDSYYRYDEDNNSLDIDRVFFLTTKDTASASEMVINGLKPFKNVITIGSKTHGKPVGMRGRKNKDLIYWLIDFSVYNANNEGDYYDGISVECNADDDLLYSRMDANDTMIFKALEYIDNDFCL